MTPTEQDKELRESTRKSIALLVAQRRGAVKWDEQDYIAAGNILFVCTKLITADRKRVALEARIDELEGLSVGVDDMCAEEWHERLTDLTNQLNQMKGEK